MGDRMIDDWQMKFEVERDYKENKFFVMHDGKIVGEYQRIWMYGTFYTENSIHFLIEENGNYKWVTYGKDGKLLGETKPYKKIKILGRNLYRANGTTHMLDDHGREIDIDLETIVNRHNIEDEEALKNKKLLLQEYLKNKQN